MNFIKENLALVLAFVLPIAMILVVVGSMTLPSLFLSTNYNFIYTACTDGVQYYSEPCDKYLAEKYRVVDSRLMIFPVDTTNYPYNDLTPYENRKPNYSSNYADRIFLHDTKENVSREISYEEAQKLTINNLLTSPDGITVSGDFERSGGGFFFLFDGGGSSYGHYLTKGKRKERLNLINDSNQYYYQKNFKFIGWVLPGRN